MLWIVSPISVLRAQKTTSSQLPAEGRPISEPTRGRAGKDKSGKASKRGGRKQTASPNMDGVKPHNQKSGQAHSAVSSERGRVSEPALSSSKSQPVLVFSIGVQDNSVFKSSRSNVCVLNSG